MKYSVQAVILNDKREVLAVSRKDDHSDFGLVGGKVDPEDLNPREAMARETFEETGLRINTATMEVVFQMHKDGYMGITYLVHNWSGEIKTNEPHIVKWCPFWMVTKGSFGSWNTLVKESLDGMGVEYFDEDSYQLMVDEVIKYCDSPTNNKDGISYRCDDVTNNGISNDYTVHILDSENSEPDEQWDDEDNNYENGLKLIGKKYGINLSFPYYYYNK